MSTAMSMCGPSLFFGPCLKKLQFLTPINDGTGVLITWASDGPSTEHLLEFEDITNSKPQEFSITPTETSIFFPAPYPISTHHSLHKRKEVPSKPFPVWIGASFPFQADEERHNAIESYGVLDTVLAALKHVPSSSSSSSSSTAPPPLAPSKPTPKPK